jgi:twitching motility two-component system response regulator PilG
MDVIYRSILSETGYVPAMLPSISTFSQKSNATHCLISLSAIVSRRSRWPSRFGFYYAAGEEKHHVGDIANPNGIKVMVIDDSNTIRKSAEIFLVQAGYQVVLAEDGFDALAKIADHQPDVIFCDILMPRLDGYQTCALIKKNARFSATPVIMLSSKDGLFDRARGRMVGSDEYLTKPFTKDSLLKTVAAHMARRHAS